MRTPLAVGQTRADPDPRHKGRTVTVIAFDFNDATVKSNRGRKSTIYCHVLERWPVVIPTQQEPKP
jgi:hypothetical protein